MLSIKALKPGSESYYLALAAEDYYLKGGEPPGHWLGSGAKILGLKGQVTAEPFKNLFRGFSPSNASKALVQNAGKENRQAAWDLTFSAPKTVSVLWSAAKDLGTKREIQDAHLVAVDAALKYAEEQLAFSRIGRGGKQRVTARLVAAAFPHSTSRALDPQLHFHVIVLNLALNPDGNTRTILSKPFYDEKMLLGAVYRAEFAHQLQVRLGLPLERKRTWFEVLGIPASLVRETSTRRREIEQELGRLGLETASAAAYANLKTRKLKELVPPRETLSRGWELQAAKHGLTQAAIKALLGTAHPIAQETALNHATKEALQTLTNEYSHFSKSEFLRAVLEAPSSLGVEFSAIENHAKRFLKRDHEIISLGVRNYTERYTTKEVLALEEKLLRSAESLSKTHTKPLSDKTLTAVITKERDLSKILSPKKSKQSIPIVRAAKAIKEKLDDRGSRKHSLTIDQANALVQITQSDGKLKLLTGPAGSAKTTTLRAIREAYEAEGFTVIGATLSGKAARELSNRAGIESNTIRMRELQLNPRLIYQLKHHARQLAITAIRTLTNQAVARKGLRVQKLTIDSKTVLVIDEASMVGTRDMEMLLTAVRKGGGIAILAGDRNQLSSIEAGGPFGSLQKRFQATELTEIIRQDDPLEREAVKLMPEGEAQKALALYAHKRQLHVADSLPDIYEQLSNAWIRAGGIEAPEDNIICAARNQEIDELNNIAQGLRFINGALDREKSISIKHKKDSPSSIKEETFFVGDRISFTKRNQKHKIENGDTATLIAIKNTPFKKQISVLIDGESKPRPVPVAEISIRRGYAFTTHKLQGATVANAFVAITGAMLNREMAYVQLSRHKKSLNLFTTAQLAGAKLTALLKEQVTPDRKHEQSTFTETRSPLATLMARPNTKDLASDVLREAREAISPYPLSRTQAETALLAFARNGHLSLSDSESESVKEVIKNWSNDNGPRNPSQTLMFAASDESAKELNQLAQAERKSLGLIDDSKSVDLGDETLYLNDRVQILRSRNVRGSNDINIGTIVDIPKQGTLKLKVDKTDEILTLNTGKAKLSLAYALPIEELQKQSPNKAHVLMQQSISDKNMTSVYHSKHRETLRLYTTNRTAGPMLSKLVLERLSPKQHSKPKPTLHPSRPLEITSA